MYMFGSHVSNFQGSKISVYWSCDQ